ncbi:MAG: trypsin-like peptidase domain-containing protein [Planctomycetota bacterium]
MTQSRGKTEGGSGFLRRALPWLNLSLAFLLTVGVAGVTTRVVETEHESQRLERDLAETRGQLDDAQRARRQILDEVGRRESANRAAMEAAHRREQTDIENRLGSLNERLEALVSHQRNGLAETAAGVRGEIEELRRSFSSEFERRRPADEVFREFAESHRSGIVLIYTEFDYDRIEEGRRRRRKTVTGWGTGFFATRDGHIVTNKHVVYPWKFDADLAAMEAMGEIEIQRASLRITCWRAGSRVLDARGEPLATEGFNTFDDRNLVILGSAPDVMREERIEIGTYSASYRVHELNDDDIVILRAEGGDFEPLPMSEDPWGGIRTLDPIMALGFPRGQKGLEAQDAVVSATVGAVRKVENTIQVTAPIIPGNSGGPLVGPRGEVVGIVTRIYSETLGICIKIERARHLLATLRESEAEAAAAAR